MDFNLKPEPKTVEHQAKKTKQESSISARLLNRLFFTLAICCFFALFFVGYFFIIRPQAFQLKSIQTVELPYLEQELLDFTQEKANLVKINNLYNSIDPMLLEKVYMVLPNDSMRSDLLVNIESIVSSVGYVLESVGIKPDNRLGEDSKEASGIQTINLEIVAKGSGYTGLKNLIDRLEHNLRLFDVISFNFAPKDSVMRINLRAYYF